MRLRQTTKRLAPTGWLIYVNGRNMAVAPGSAVAAPARLPSPAPSCGSFGCTCSADWQGASWSRSRTPQQLAIPPIARLLCRMCQSLQGQRCLAFDRPQNLMSKPMSWCQVVSASTSMQYFAQAVCEFTADQVADTDASYGAFSSCAHSHPNHQDLNGWRIDKTHKKHQEKILPIKTRKLKACARYRKTIW